MSETIALNTGWKMGWREYGGNHASPEWGLAGATMEAEVPGDVHLDLMRAGLLPDLYEAMNLDHARWMERKDWWYTCEFPTPDSAQGKSALLVFHGLDASPWGAPVRYATGGWRPPGHRPVRR